MLETIDIKQSRKKLKMTAQELAVRLGVSVTTVSRWENGKNKPSPMALIRMQELLSTPRK